jgi:putative nucleotidyltransferase with HDIG domain
MRSELAEDNPKGVLTHAGIGTERCLIVEDEARLRQALSRLMRGAGFICLEAGTGHEALEVLAREPVALVLSDMRMPGMDGSELLRTIRERYPDIAVVMITAVAEVEVAVSCLSAGAMDYITKPFVFDEVQARVAQALEKRRLIRENHEYQERLEERVRAQAERLEQLFVAGVQTLVEALELKDPYTRGHSVRVSQYGSAVAQVLGLDAEYVRQIEIGGQLHDIGKIGVREEVLNKAGPLTDDEYAHIMTHPELGWRILRPLLSDAPIVLNVVRSHHEWMNGTGVPDGCSGEEIPREARIIAVVDAFDAMMSQRPYRPGLRSYESVLDELWRNAGVQFDPEVVEAFLEVVASGRIDLGPRGSGITEARRLLLTRPVRA